MASASSAVRVASARTVALANGTIVERASTENLRRLIEIVML
jgi:hypothetical protein